MRVHEPSMARPSSAPTCPAPCCKADGVIEAELRDGSRVVIRPLVADDKEGLAAAFERASERTRYLRFLGPTPALTAKQLAYLTEIDHHDHEALVAIEPSSGEGLGIARYVRSSQDPAAAECAVAVADEWQGRGLGTALLRRLMARARDEGIERITALVLSQNREALGLLEAVGRVEERVADHGTIEVSLDIPDEPQQDEHERRFACWLRAAATGLLDSPLMRQRGKG
jgi:ribosomal protein S18 acetylase RimI-like enzyme